MSRIRALVAGMAVAGASIATGSTYTWDGTANNWNVTNHWSPAGLPGVGDTGIVNGGIAQMNVDLVGGPTIQVNAGGTVRATANVNPNLILNGGTFSMTANQTIGGTTTVQSASTISLNTKNYLFSTVFVGTGDLAMTNATAYNGANCDQYGYFYGNSAGYSGTVHIQGPIGVGFDWALGSNNTVSVDNGGWLTVRQANHAHPLTLNGGTVRIQTGQTLSGNLTVSAPSTLTEDYGKVYATGQITGTNKLSISGAGLSSGVDLKNSGSASTWSGGFDVTAGNVFLDAAGSQGNGPLYVPAGNTLCTGPNGGWDMTGANACSNNISGSGTLDLRSADYGGTRHAIQFKGNTINPGGAGTVGTLTVNACSLTLTNNGAVNAALKIDVSSGSTYDVLNFDPLGYAPKTLTLNGASLQVTLLPGIVIPGPSTMLYIVRNAGCLPIAGTFSGLSNNATIDFGGGTNCQITYFATNTVDGTTNDVALYNFAAPVAPAAPVVNNGAGVTNLLSSSCYLSGNVSQGTPAPSVYVCYGLTSGGTSTSAWNNVVYVTPYAGAGPFSIWVTGLLPSSNYYYSCFATNSQGGAWSSVSNFLTPAAASLIWTNTGWVQDSTVYSWWQPGNWSNRLPACAGDTGYIPDGLTADPDGDLGSAGDRPTIVAQAGSSLYVLNSVSLTPLVLAGGTLNFNYHSDTYGGPITVISNSSIISSQTTDNPSDHPITGTMSGASNVTLTTYGSQYWQGNSSNLYCTLHFGAGKFGFTAVGALGSGPLILDSGAQVTWYMDYQNYALTLTNNVSGVGTLYANNAAGCTLQGNTVMPGTATNAGVLTVNSPLCMITNATLAINVFNAAAYGQLLVTNGTTTLGNASLSVALAANVTLPSSNANLCIVRNIGTNALSGIFGSLPEGATINLGGNTNCQITYGYCADGDSKSNDIALYNFAVTVLPSITVSPATNVTATSAYLNGNLVGIGMGQPGVWVYWGTNSGGTNASSWATNYFCGTNSAAIPASYTFQATNLISNQSYSYRYYAQNATGGVWSLEQSFTTFGPPVVDNGLGVTSQGTTYATLNGNLSITGGSPTTVTIYWGMNSNNWANTNSFGTRPAGTFSNTVTTLWYGNRYYYQCFATNGWGGTYTAPVSFNAARPGAATLFLTNAPSSGLTATSAVLNATLACSGSVYNVTLYWGTNSAVTNVASCTNAASWSNSVTFGWFTNLTTASNLNYTLTGMAPNTTYYYTFLATNALENLWATNVQSVRTYLLAVDNDGGATNVSPGVTGLRGTVYNGQSSTVFVGWGTANSGTNGQWANTNILSNVGDGLFTNTVSNLLYGLQYYYCCWATNLYSSGTAAASTNFTSMRPGGNAIFMTNAPVSGLTTTSATVNVNVAFSGAVYNATLFWGSSNGGTNAAAWSNSVPLGWYTNLQSTGYPYTLTGLASGTTYSATFRATNILENLWATNVVTFTTLCLPNVNVYGGATNLKATAATLQGQVTAGTPTPQVYLCWGNTNPGGSNTSGWQNVTAFGVMTGLFSTNVTSLAQGATTCYRCYATNSVGDSYADTNFVTPLYNTYTFTNNNANWSLASSWSPFGGPPATNSDYGIVPAGMTAQANADLSGSPIIRVDSGGAVQPTAGINPNLILNGGTLYMSANQTIGGTVVVQAASTISLNTQNYIFSTVFVGTGDLAMANAAAYNTGVNCDQYGYFCGNSTGYSGTVHIQGPIGVGFDWALGSNNTVYVDNGGWLTVRQASHAHPLTLNGGTVRIQNGQTLSGNVTLNAPSTLTEDYGKVYATGQITGTNKFSISAVGLTGGVGLRNSGNASAWSGGFDVIAGNVFLDASGSQGNGPLYVPSGNTICTGPNGGWDMTGPNACSNNISGSGSLDLRSNDYGNTRHALEFKGNTINPGGTGTVGTLTINACSLTLTNNGATKAKLAIEVSSGSSYDVLNFDPVGYAPKTLNINGCSLQVTLLPGVTIPGPSTMLYIVRNAGCQPITGTFDGLTNNATIDFGGGTNCQITFFATNTVDGTTNDVALYNFSTPASTVTPAVDNGAGVTNLLPTCCDLSGNVSLGTPGPSAYVCYGATSGGTSTGAWDHSVYINPYAGSGPFSIHVIHLLPGSNYYYSCFATNSAGGAWSSVSNFVTPAAATLTWTNTAWAADNTTYCWSHAGNWSNRLPACAGDTGYIPNGRTASPDGDLGTSGDRPTIVAQAGSTLYLLNSVNETPLVLAGGTLNFNYHRDTYAAPITLTADSSIVSSYTTDNPSDNPITGALSGASNLTLTTQGSLYWQGNSPNLHSRLHLGAGKFGFTDAGALGTGPLALDSGAQVTWYMDFLNYALTVTNGVSGFGTLCANNAAGCTLRGNNVMPGAATNAGVLTVNSPLCLLTNATLAINVFSNGVCGLLLATNGNCILANVALAVTLGYAPAPGDGFGIVHATGTVTGRFSQAGAILNNGVLADCGTYGGSHYYGTILYTASDVTLTNLMAQPVVTNLVATNVLTTSASMDGTLTQGTGPTTITLYWGTSDGTTNATGWSHANSFGTTTPACPVVFSTNIAGLIQDTNYWYTFYASNAVGTSWAQPSASFLTYGVPVISNVLANVQGSTSATLSGYLYTTGSSPTHVWINWGTDTNNWANTTDLGYPGLGTISAAAANLYYGFSYYYNCCASNVWGTVSTTPSNFVTPRPAVSLTDAAASVVTTTSAVLNATLACPGAAYGVTVYWNTFNGGTNAGTWINSQSLGGYTNQASAPLNFALSGLTPITTYYFTFRATNALDDLWATNVQSFQTFGVPQVNNGTGAAHIGPWSVTLNGQIVTNGGLAAEAFVCWGTTDQATTGVWDHVADLGVPSDVFATNLTGLMEDQTYYYRCYAINVWGIGWAPASTNFMTYPAPGTIYKFR